MATREYVLHIMVDGHEHPAFAWAHRYSDDGQAYWIADQEFGPFDGLIDVHRWLWMAMRKDRGSPTS